MPKNSNKSNFTRPQAHGFQPADSKTIRERLRREAIESRPEFSESLHQRIIRSVGERYAEGAAVGSRNTAAGRRWRGLTAVLAAACVLAAVAIGWRFGANLMRPDGRPLSPDNMPATSSFVLNGKIEDLPPMNVLTDLAVTGLDGLLASTGFALPSTQLAHDARLAADSLLQRIPLDMELADDR
ncbi:MAG: hypothetical protein KKE86_11995 [Planctomycetes bacterium]|nr:hypothetical protein [Planctomycetota bacterium]MBU4400044.1 hypothetical protein [Planctomycetota bacterium]MCG2682625.1 hypothetical protein [Planctomycetales bacterium]